MNQLLYRISIKIFQEYQRTIWIDYQCIPRRLRGNLNRLQTANPTRSAQGILFHLEVSIKRYLKLLKKKEKKFIKLNIQGTSLRRHPHPPSPPFSISVFVQE